MNRNEIVECEECELTETCRMPVPYAGRNELNVFIIGEAPGREEDEKGKPFVGESGKALKKAAFKAGIDIWKDCHITNMVKCRPPGNRTPEKGELSACFSKWLGREFVESNPKHALLLGKTAAETLLPFTSIGHGGKLKLKGIMWYFLYHPSYWLRRGGDVWVEDNVLPYLREWGEAWKQR